MKLSIRPLLSLLLIILMLSTAVLPVAAMQDDDAAQQELIGTVDAFEGTVMIVGGQVLDVSSATIGEGVAVGETVIVQATTTDSGIWLASSVDLHVVVPVVAITLDGEIEAIDGNIITLGGLQVFIEPDDPALALLEVGVSVIIEGEVRDEDGRMIIVAVSITIVDPDATPEPEETPPPGDDGDLPVTIVIEGPVQAININIITVFDFDVQVEPSDPILIDLEVGDHVRVEGNTIVEGDTIIIVAVNIVVINVIIIDQSGPIIVQPGLPDGCRVTPKGKIKCTGRSGRSSRRS